MTGPLISAADLLARLGEVELFDLRWSLTDPTHGVRAYEEGHLPGAVFVDLDRDLAAVEGSGRHPLPSVSGFRETLGRLGVGRESHVVVYDDVSGGVAARMWWMLRSIGHHEVKLLDGGLQAWVGMGYPLVPGRVTPEPTTYPAFSEFTGVVRHDQLEGRVVADVRAPERYRGDVEPVDPKAGHIPGAVNYPIAGNLDNGMFLSGSELAERYREFPDDGVVACGSGVNACQAAIALVLAGRAMPDVYVGSFSDWSRRDLPVATGPNP
ncbi:MAG TPA: sulfurtransferase [Acidimicrobiia bacterium]|jgi:thiosulfate/3-mercaptopyruvate sulfurtransferase